MKKKLIIIGVLLVAVIAAVFLFLHFRSQNPYNYDLSKYVKVGQYKGLEYSVGEATVSNEELEQAINHNLEQAAKEKEVKEGTVENGDTVNIGYEGTIDGKKFDGGSTDSQDVTVGTTPMIEGFTEGLVGHKVGETVTLDLTFPKDYQKKDLAGKDVVFKVKINSKKVREVPKLDEAFVKENTKYKTVEEYKEAVKKELLESRQQMLENSAKQKLWAEILSKSKVIKYPKKELEEAKKKTADLEKQYKAQASAYKMSWDDFLKNVLNTDEKGFSKMMDEYAENSVLNELVLYSIAKDQHIEVTKKTFKKNLDDILKKSGYTEKTFEEAFHMSIEEYAEKNGWKQNMLLDEVLNFVMKNGKKVDPPKEEATDKEAVDSESSQN